MLMEFFAWDPRVLRTFAHHYKTGQSLPDEVAVRLCQGRTMFGALEMQRQVLYALIDQIYHGKHPLDGSTTDVLAQVQEQYTVIPHVPVCGAIIIQVYITGMKTLLILLRLSSPKLQV